MDLKDVGWVTWTYLADDKGQLAGSCECGNEPSGFIKLVEFLEQLRTC
jgi:hypothetical protein